jgi:hypothetical protein
MDQLAKELAGPASAAGPLELVGPERDEPASSLPRRETPRVGS